jgi:hypothetical protein
VVTLEATQRASPAATPRARPRLLVFIVAYDAGDDRERAQADTSSPVDDYDVETLVIDHSSQDTTFDRSETIRRGETLPFPLQVLSTR